MMPKVNTERPKRKRETLTYIQSMLRELKIMAEAERSDMLAYLIEMAYIEASDAFREHVPKVPKQTAV